MEKADHAETIQMSKLKKTLLLVLVLLFGAGIFFHRMARGRAERTLMFLEAVVSGDTKKAGEMLARDPDLALMRDGKGKGGIGSPVLCAAIQHGHGDIVKILLSNGAAINAKNHFGQQPLHYACVFRHKEVVKILLGEGADVNAKDDNGHTPLRLASFPKRNPAKDIVEMLREKGGRK